VRARVLDELAHGALLAEFSLVRLEGIERGAPGLRSCRHCLHGLVDCTDDVAGVEAFLATGARDRARLGAKVCELGERGVGECNRLAFSAASLSFAALLSQTAPIRGAGSQGSWSGDP
jgi:hypothetical protein